MVELDSLGIWILSGKERYNFNINLIGGRYYYDIHDHKVNEHSIKYLVEKREIKFAYSFEWGKISVG